MINEVITIAKKYYKLINDDKKILRPFYFGYFINVMLTLLVPILVARITSSITETNYSLTFICIILFFIVSSLKPILTSFNMHTYAKFFNANYITLHKKVISSFYKRKGGYLEIPTGEILSTLTNDVVNIGEIADSLLTFILNNIKLVILFIYFINLNIYLAILICFINIVYLKISNILTEKNLKEEKLQRKENDTLLSLINQTILGLKDIKTLDLKENMSIKYDSIYKRWSSHYLKKRNYYINRLTITELLLVTIQSLIYLICLYSIVNGQISLATLLLIISYYSDTFSSTKEITSSYNSLKIQSVSLKRINDLIVEEKNTKKLLEINECIGEYYIKHVSFSYSKKSILKNINARIYPNKITAIIGENGSGKTTLLDLILKLKTPTKGSILLDKVNIAEIDTDAYLNNISVLNQETYLFNLSIKENFNLACKDKKRQEEICALTGVDKLLASLPKKENTILNEATTNISGGQKRLISLTRTLLKDSKILILDEITSSLDKDITKNVCNILKTLKKDHTIIIVTHKKELINIADEIIDLDEK